METIIGILVLVVVGYITYKFFNTKPKNKGNVVGGGSTTLGGEVGSSGTGVNDEISTLIKPTDN